MRRACFSPLLLAVVVARAGGQGPPTTRVLDCTNSGCHAQQLDHKFLHGPTAIHSCDSCHEYSDPKAHKFLLKRTGADLCAFCHIDKTGKDEPIVHDPVAKADCTGCHDPHGSNSRQMLKKDTVAQTCITCHKDTLAHPVVHKPAADKCTECHKPHSASHAKLLTMDPRALCISCHEDVGKTATDSPHRHAPATDDCMKCHWPHASKNPRILKAPAQVLCTSCHEEVGQKVTDAPHPHGAATDERSCLNCHLAHGSEHAMQLKNDPVAACMECHQKPVKTSSGRTVAAVSEIMAKGAHLHGPIAKGDCSACHAVHGGDQDNLLIHPYSTGFYLPFSQESYSLCFACHDSRLAASETSDGITGFRDGNKNLHWLHVAKSSQGRSCGACHNPHAGQNASLIADSVAFGQWKLPINFKPTDAGGSCAPGCHKPATYDRAAGGAPAEKPRSVKAPEEGANEFVGPMPEAITPEAPPSEPR